MPCPAPEAEATLPGPHIASLWQTHRSDAAAFGTDRLTHSQPRQSLAWDTAWPKTRARYRDAFAPRPLVAPTRGDLGGALRLADRHALGRPSR